VTVRAGHLDQHVGLADVARVVEVGGEQGPRQRRLRRRIGLVRAVEQHVRGQRRHQPGLPPRIEVELAAPGLGLDPGERRLRIDPVALPQHVGDRQTLGRQVGAQHERPQPDLGVGQRTAQARGADVAPGTDEIRPDVDAHGGGGHARTIADHASDRFRAGCHCRGVNITGRRTHALATLLLPIALTACGGGGATDSPDAAPATVDAGAVDAVPLLELGAACDAASACLSGVLRRRRLLRRRV
jgi:hypothetical protein